VNAPEFPERGGNLVGFVARIRTFANCATSALAAIVSRRLRRRMFSRRVKWIAGDDFTRGDEFAADKTPGQCGGHFARAEKADVQFGDCLFVTSRAQSGSETRLEFGRTNLFLALHEKVLENDNPPNMGDV